MSQGKTEPAFARVQPRQPTSCSSKSQEHRSGARLEKARARCIHLDQQTASTCERSFICPQDLAPEADFALNGLQIADPVRCGYLIKMLNKARKIFMSMLLWPPALWTFRGGDTLGAFPRLGFSSLSFGNRFTLFAFLPRLAFYPFPPIIQTLLIFTR
jgi:hypothetical protein